MTGEELKRKIKEAGSSQKELAELLGVTAQSISSILSAKDVRSGTIEKIAEALGRPVSYFFDEASGTAVVTGNHSAASVHGNASVGASNEVLEERLRSMQQLLDEKERTIKILMGK